MQQSWRITFLTLKEIKDYAKKHKINIRKVNIKSIVLHVKELVDSDINDTAQRYLREAFKENGLI